MCAQAIRHRTDTKLYRIQSPQTPVVRTRRYKDYHMDEFPSGTNMIVAVLAYTGGWPQGSELPGVQNSCYPGLCDLAAVSFFPMPVFRVTTKVA